jgi:hypothetical protein
MNRTLQYGAIAFIVVSSLMWTAVVLKTMNDASPRAKAACAGIGASLWSGPNAYYWCLDRVEAGGRP